MGKISFVLNEPLVLSLGTGSIVSSDPMLGKGRRLMVMSCRWVKVYWYETISKQSNVRVTTAYYTISGNIMKQREGLVDALYMMQLEKFSEIPLQRQFWIWDTVTFPSSGPGHHEQSK